MAAEGYLQPFDSIGITPPRGRGGHSVPLPRPLTGACLRPFAQSGAASGTQLHQPPNDAQKSDVQSHLLGTVGLSPAQFYVHRDHTLGGSISKLDRLRTHQELPYLETFAEEEEDNDELEERRPESIAEERDEVDSGRPISRQSRDLGQGKRGRQMSITLDKFTGDSLLHFSYSAVGGGAPGGMHSDTVLGGSFVRAFTQGLNSSLNVPFVHQNTSLSSPPGETSALFPTASRNPNKAIITIDGQSSRILVANEMTCELFGYQKDELAGMKVQNLFTEPYRTKQQALVEQNIDSSGATVLISGKVMDAVTAFGVEFPVSVWMKRVIGASLASPSPSPGSKSHDQKTVPLRVIVVIEPVERSSAFFTMDQDGKIVSCDPWFAVLFGFSDSPEVIGKSILKLIPSLELPTSTELIDKGISKQAATGRTKDDTVFPLTVKFTDVSQNLSVGDLYSPSSTMDNPLDQLQKQEEAVSGSPTRSGKEAVVGGAASSAVRGDCFCVNAKVIVYAALSGMVSFLPDGTIYGCNHHFAVMLFGYSQEELLKKDITFLIPEFYNHINYVDDRNMPLPPLDEEEMFHDVMEHSYTPDATAAELVKNWNTGSRGHQHHHQSPGHRRSLDFQNSPAKKQLNFQDVAVTVVERDLSAPMDIVEGKSLLYCENSIGETSKMSFDNLAEREQMLNRNGSIAHKEEEDIATDPLAIMDDLARSNLARDIARPLSSMSEPNRTEVDKREVPRKLVPSASTERIMDILRERGLHVDNYDGSSSTGTGHVHRMGEGKLILSQSLEEVDEESYISDEDEVSIYPKIHVSSSTPAVKSEDQLHQSRLRGSRLEGLQSPTHIFSVGSSPVHGSSSQELNRRPSLNSLVSLPEGTYLGEAKHKDGSLMSIVFQLKPITLADGMKLFCVWISRDLDCERARTADLSMSMSKPPPDPYRSNQIISPDVGIPGVGLAVGGVSAPAHRISDPVGGYTLPSHSLQLTEEILAVEGEYSVNYDTLSSIGKGAFGFVRLAQRRQDGMMVVVKFLRKSSVLKDCWVDDEEMGRVPREIQLLARLSHPNIVQLLEAYENEHFFQMVMEKHGDGLDLFEFIERNPRLDEPLISYMFRQIVAGLSYLHEQGILHRDVKDENIIVDRQFILKLIDFGSAAYMEPGKKFNTFCGTLEYCSPEVLLGNSYTGPELEMWALGVTLYTLVFGENPFFDVEETISGHLQPPFLTSPALMKVVFWLLHPDPKSRATLKDLNKDKWTNQAVDISRYNFDTVLGYVTSVASPTGPSGSAHKQPQQLHSQAVVSLAAASKRSQHLVKSNSETDAHQLERALEEQLQFSEEDNRKLL